MKKKQQFEVQIEKLSYGGKGIGRVNGRVVFVDGGIPGDRAAVIIRKVKSNYAEARIAELLQPSSLRQPAPCDHFGFCGGCKWQSLDYQRQVEFKRAQLLESLEHIAEWKPDVIHPTIPSPRIFGYRNKTEFSFTANRWLTPDQFEDPRNEKNFALGFHVPGGFDRVMHIQNCWLQDETMNRILNFSQAYFKKSHIPVFHVKKHVGNLRFLVIRKSFSENKIMVNVVTFEPAHEILQDYARQLTEKFPQVSTVINTVNRRYAQIAYGDEEYILHGEGTIRERLGNFEFEISANSFFQTNPLQAVNIYRKVQEYVGNESQLVWDLYSGTGTVAMFLARRADRVTGFELVESAVRDAKLNCSRNGVTNCRFISGEIRHHINQTTETPDVIVCDPPRAGLHPEVVKAILKVDPKKIVYVSCNPATMARDLKPMRSHYRLTDVQPVDMFPHTFHIESVAKLERK